MKRWVGGVQAALAGLALSSSLLTAQTLGVSLEERIGSLDGPRELSFYRVYSGELVPDGFWIAHRGDQAIRKYGLDGAPIRSLGRKGSGPGEFERLVDVAVDEETVLGLDGLGRITLFHANGDAETHHLRELPALVELEGLVTSPSGWMAIGTLRVDPRGMGSLARDSVVMLEVREDWSVHRIGRALPSRWWRQIEDEDAYRLRAVRDGPLGLLDVGGVVAATSNDEAVVTLRYVIGGDGREWTESSLRASRGSTEVGGRFFEQVVVGDGIWVSEARTTDGYRNWWLISAEGVTEGTVRLPERSRVLDADERYLLVRSLDDLDVERIELWRIARSTGS